MRVEYQFGLDEVKVPRLAVEAVEGIGKLFTLATLVLNVIEKSPRVDLVFHGLNRDDPARKIEAFKEIIASAPEAPEFIYATGNGGSSAGSSVYYQWLICRIEA